jgi:Ca2+-binding RTX toxin-like protein
MTHFNGTRGADLFIGTSECDQFYVNSYDDIIIGGGAGDSVVSSIDYVLNDGITYLLLTGRAINGTGNNTENNVIGNRQDNILNGGRGIDRLKGGGGRDTFVFDCGGRSNADYLMDFTGGTDTLAISADAFGLAAGAGFDYQVGWEGLGAGPTFVREELQDLAPTIWFANGSDRTLLCTLQWQRNSTTAADFAIL